MTSKITERLKTIFLPAQKSAIGGMINIVLTYPMKNIEPINPILYFGSHKRSNLSGLTQLSMYSSSLTGLH